MTRRSYGRALPSRPPPRPLRRAPFHTVMSQSSKVAAASACKMLAEPPRYLIHAQPPTR